MYCFIDESGNTGLELFDDNQPILYYGVITSRNNLDVTAEPLLKKLRKQLSVDRLHANQLGVGGLTKIANEISIFSKKNDVRFSLFSVNKPDHALIAFYDQVFDSGMNEAVTWSHYFTPLRYPLLFKVSSLFDRNLLKDAWKARRETNTARSAEMLTALCNKLLERIDSLKDQRSRDVVGGALKWAAANPYEIEYGVGNKDTALQISPNLVGFQQVLMHVAASSKSQGRKVNQITVDRQTEFNKAQGELAIVYQKMRGIESSLGPGMPKMDLSHMPETSPVFKAGDTSAGLELVDVTLWIAKRALEKKPLSNELRRLLATQGKRGKADEVSLKGLEKRWSFLAQLPHRPDAISDEVAEIFAKQEKARLAAIEGL